jgi:hypothetical protein
MTRLEFELKSAPSKDTALRFLHWLEQMIIAAQRPLKALMLVKTSPAISFHSVVK